MSTPTKEDYSYDAVPRSEPSTTMAKFDLENVEVHMPNRVVINSRKFLYIAACVANISAFICGTSFGWTSPEIPILKSNGSSNPLSFPLTPSEESWIGSLLPLGASLGPFAGGFALDKIGRKNTLLIGTAPFIVAYSLMAFGSTVVCFLVARFMSGLAVGVVFTVLPMYVAEISEDEVRGALSSFMQLFITIGLLFSYIVGPYVEVKLFNLACVVFPVVFLIVFYMFIPESPYFLIKNNRKAAAEALAKFRACSTEAVEDELNDIESSVTESENNKASFMDIFKSKGLTKALILSVGLVSLQQLSGINIVLFYAQDIFTTAGSTIPAEICTIIIGVVQVLASGVTPALVEKKGKRYLLTLSALGMALSQGILAVFFFLKSSESPIADKIAFVPVVSLVCYIITYCLGFGPLPWAAMGELFPGNIKSVASTVTAAECWFLGFLLTNYFSMVTDWIGSSGAFGIFAFCCLGAAWFVQKYLPETSGKSLQEIQEILAK